MLTKDIKKIYKIKSKNDTFIIENYKLILNEIIDDCKMCIEFQYNNITLEISLKELKKAKKLQKKFKEEFPEAYI